MSDPKPYTVEWCHELDPSAKMSVVGVSMVRLLATAQAAAEVATLKAQLEKLEVRRFPVMDAGFSIPWAVVAPFEPQALENHDQTLAVLASRGGLDAPELWCVMHGKAWKDLGVTHEAALAWARTLVTPSSAEASLTEALDLLERVAERGSLTIKLLSDAEALLVKNGRKP